MSKVTESIFSGSTHVIPLAEVLYIKGQKTRGMRGAIWVVMKGSTANNENGDWNNAPFLRGLEADAFISAWCGYRSELEAETLTDLTA